MSLPLVVAGIGTDVGKTVVSALLCRQHELDYWKPVASGSEDGPVDHEIMRGLLSGLPVKVHEPRYTFKKSLSPHVAAALEGRDIELEELVNVPKTDRGILVELAGGVLVPLNDLQTNLDLVSKWRCAVVVVSRHYLGSINHTLLTLEALRGRGALVLGVVFNGDELPDTERIISKLGRIDILGRVPKLTAVTAATIQELANQRVVELPDLSQL
jgi:dethiobiotin synthetase